MIAEKQGRIFSVCRITALACFVLTVCFIWSNSMRTGFESSEQSGFFENIFKQIFNVTEEPFRFLYENLRKVAHFAEFALLGIEAACVLLLGQRRRMLRFALTLLICFFVALGSAREAVIPIAINF